MELFLSPAASAALVSSLGLIVVDGAVVMRWTLYAGRTPPRWTLLLPALALVAWMAQAAANWSFNPIFVFMSVPIYLATLIIVLGGMLRGVRWLVRRLRRRAAPRAARRLRLPRIALGVLCGIAVLFGALRLGQTYVFAGGISGRIRVLEVTPGGADLSDRSWSEAFAGLNETLRTQYPFTELKQLDWSALYAEFAPRIAAAEAQQDVAAYYRVLREFAWRIPDGHVGLDGDDGGLEQAEIGGSYGMRLLELDDGRFVVGDALAGGPAARAGVETGAEITAWNGAPPAQALAHTSLLWSEAPPATREGERLQQLRFLGRAPIGARAELSFRNPGMQAPHTATLYAAAAPAEQHGGLGLAGLWSPSVNARVLPSGYGYVRVRNMVPNLAGFPDAQLRWAVAGFVARGVPGVIVDVRDNGGGESTITARMLGLFQPEQRLYHYLGLLDPAMGGFRPATQIPLLIEPAPVRFDGPVAVLVDEYSRSAAEDLANVLQQLPNGFVVGINGTAGAGGTSEADVQLPGNYVFMFPKARSLDSTFEIMIESDAAGAGGVTPDLRVPLDEATVAALSSGRDVVLERAEATLDEQLSGHGSTGGG